MPNNFEVIKVKELFPVVPVFNYTNKPVVPWKKDVNRLSRDYELKGVNEYIDYINNKNEVKKSKVTGYALITGKDSGIMVLDLDRNHGDGSKDGIKAYKELIEGLQLTEEEQKQAFDTFTVKTPNGGLHLYFKYKEGLKNDSNQDLSIDIRTDGGLIITPGSLRKIGEDIREYTVYKDNPIYDIPIKLFDKLTEYFGVNKVKGDKPKETNKKPGRPPKNNEYYTVTNEGGRDNALIKYLGRLITQPMFRNIHELLPMAMMYNQCYINPPLDAQEVENKVNSILSYAKPVYCKDNGKIINGSLVKYVLDKSPSYIKGNMLYIYNEELGIYEYKDTRDQLKLYYDHVIIDEDIDPGKADKFAKTIHSIADNHKELFIYENRYINCLNGVIDTETDELLEFTPQIKLDTKFNGNYYDIDKYKEDYNKSKFKSFLENILDDGTILTLQEAWGVMLCPNATKVQQCFIYKGEGSNGKSSLFDIQTALLYDKDKSVCGIGLGKFGDEFIMAMAEGRRVNIVRDDTVEGKINGVFKSAVCGEEITVNKKNKDHVQMKFNMAWFYGLNRMPVTNDKSYGFFRRPIFIPFNVRFGTKEQVQRGEADKIGVPGIVEDIISNELDIVFMWAYEGLKRLKANNWKVTQSEASIQEMEEYKEEADSVYAFYKDNLIRVPGHNLHAKTLYEEYENWCLMEKINSPMNVTQFGRQMASYGHKKSTGMAHDIDKPGNKVFFDVNYKKNVYIPTENTEKVFEENKQSTFMDASFKPSNIGNSPF